MENPIPKDESDRLLQPSDYDLDYDGLEGNLKDLARLVAKVAETDVSLINLIDSYTQWSVATEGVPAIQMPREDSVCQCTIMDDQSFEVKDLSKDKRVKDKSYVKEDPNLK
jgi:hypothetical protein